MDKAKAILHDVANRYCRLSRRGKTILWSVLTLGHADPRGIVAINIALLIAVLIITPHRIGQWMNDGAVWLRGLGPVGMLICCCLVGGWLDGPS
jgi:hypothetical protein